MWFKVFLISFIILGMLGNIASIGKERKPMNNANDVMIMTIIDLFIIYGLLFLI